MDYEKEYKDALKRAKAIIEIAANKDEAIGFANTIFPEFKRERSESIRKLLIKTIKQVPNDSLLWETIDKSSVLIWLEKQGEQTHAWNDEDEKMMQCIHKYVKASASNFDYGNIKMWFESLKDRVQPHWKPTEEQLNALYQTSKNKYVMYNATLTLLYNDLKKL